MGRFSTANTQDVMIVTKNRIRSNDEFINFNDSYVKYLETEKASAKPDLNIQPVVKDMASAIVIADMLKFL